jgi:hypothetical protein
LGSQNDLFQIRKKLPAAKAIPSVYNPHLAIQILLDAMDHLYLGRSLARIKGAKLSAPALRPACGSEPLADARGSATASECDEDAPIGQFPANSEGVFNGAVGNRT